MKLLQPINELEKWWEKTDPWNYEQIPDDQNRRAMLLSLLPKVQYERILDIGCGDGFITSRLPGKEIIGIDISTNAIRQANKNALPHIQYQVHSLYDLPTLGWEQNFDLIVITGVLYPQYIGKSELLAYLIIDDLLQPAGHLVSCHIDEWYTSRFPYITLHREFYPYREFNHVLEVYQK